MKRLANRFDIQARAAARFHRLGALALLPLWFAACKADTEDANSRDSNSNWLTACDDASECDENSSCFKQRCMRDCGSDNDCAGTANRCLQAIEVNGCVLFDSNGARQCFAGCNTDNDCEGFAAGLACVDGACVPQGEDCVATPGVSASATDESSPSGSEPEPTPGEPGTNPSPSPEPSSDPGTEPGEPEPSATNPGTEPSMTPGTDPSTAPSGEPTPGECPAVASSCPAGCVEVTARPLNREGGLCFEFMEDVLACAVPGMASTDDDNCVRKLDGTLYTGISGSFAGPLIASGEYETCSTEDEERISSAIGTCDTVQPSATCGTALCGVGERCCDSCQNFCASPSDGVLCPDDTEPNRSCDAPTVGDGGSPSAGTLYSAQVTNGINCCDFYTVIAADPVLDYCAIVEIRHEVGSEPQAASARAVSGADDCWSKLVSNPNAVPETTGPAAGVSGLVAFTSESSVLQLDLDLVIDFSDGPASVPETVNITFDNLSLDGEWYSAP